MKNIEERSDIMSNKEIKVEENNEKVVNLSDKKKNMMYMIVAAIVLVIIFVVVFCMSKGVGKPLEEKLSNKLTKLGEEYYTDYYYPKLSENKTATEMAEILSKFKDAGIKINLDNLSKYENSKVKDELEKFKNENGKACDKSKTRAIVYPQSPYGKNDYKIEVKLECGFETAKDAK